MMKINITKEQLMDIGKAGLKIGKHVVIEGTIAVAAKGVTNGLRTSLTEGFDGVKEMDVDDYLGINKKKRKTFKEVIEEVDEEPEEDEAVAE